MYRALLYENYKRVVMPLYSIAFMIIGIILMVNYPINYVSLFFILSSLACTIYSILLFFYGITLNFEKKEFVFLSLLKYKRLKFDEIVAIDFLDDDADGLSFEIIVEYIKNKWRNISYSQKCLLDNWLFGKLSYTLLQVRDKN